ncbi:MAG: GntR family transcriptional regulator, partial [Burkholderiaceae bacterium]
ALQRLARERLVVVLPRRGIMVSDINVRQQLELIRVRRELERLMAGLSAQRATDAECQRFLEIASAMSQAGADDDDKGFMRLDLELNQLIAHACRNEFARGAMSLMQGLSRRFWYVHYRDVLDLPLCADLHAALAQAIGSGDPVRAAQASDGLMSYIESFTRKSVDA